MSRHESAPPATNRQDAKNEQWRVLDGECNARRHLPPYGRALTAARRSGDLRGYVGTSADGCHPTQWLLISTNAWHVAQHWQSRRLAVVGPPDEDPAGLDWSYLAGTDPVLLLPCGTVADMHVKRVVTEQEGYGAMTTATMDAGNREAVPRALGDKYVGRTIIIAEDRTGDEGGVGMQKGRHSTETSARQAGIPPEVGDFNDLAHSQGRAAVRVAVAGASDVAEQINAVAAAHGRIALLEMDTLPRSFKPSNESSTRDMNALVARLDAIRGWQRPAMLLVHHTDRTHRNTTSKEGRRG